MNQRLKAYLALLITAALWGLSPPIIKDALNYVTPIEFLFWRFLLVSFFIFPVFLIRVQKQPFDSRDFFKLLFLSLCGTSLTLGLWFWGLSKTTSLDSIIISSINPLLIVAGGVFLLKEKITKLEKYGLFFAFLGTLVALVFPIFNPTSTLARANFLGNILVFLGDLTWAVYTLLGKKLFAKYSSFNLTCLSFFVGLISFFPLFLHQKGWDFTVDSRALPAILFMVIFGSLIAYFTYSYGLSLIEASEATLFTYLQPIFTLPLAVWWLGETVSLFFIWGTILIILGVFLTEYKPKQLSN